MKMAIMVVLAGLVTAQAEPVKTYTEAEAWQAGWPQCPGPNYDWAALDTGVALVDNLDKARIVWDSETMMARAKAYSANDGRMPSRGIPTGGGYGPLLVDGRLYQWHYLPSGEMAKPGGRVASFFRNNTTGADLHLVCVDPADGKTLWRRVIPGVSRNFQGDKSVAPQNFSPCAAHGRVFALGEDGRLYAFRAGDGELLWERPVADMFAAVQAGRARDLLSRLRFSSHNHDYGNAPLVCIGDRVFVNAENTLSAFDAVTGTPVWELKDGVGEYFYPVPWGQRVLVSGASGIHCLDTATGKSVWLHKGIEAQTRLYRHGDKLIVLAEKQVPSKGPNSPKCEYLGPSWFEAYGTPACYRLTETGLERIWGTADQFKGTVESLVVCVSAKLCAVRGDTLFVATPESVTTGGQLDDRHRPPAAALQPGKENLIGVQGKPSGLLALDLNTGAVRSRVKARSMAECYFQRIEDRLWADNDCGHESQFNDFTDIGVTPPRLLNVDWKTPWPPTVPYTSYLQKVLVNGRMFIRTARGLTCVDFRTDPKAGFTPTPFALPKWAESLPEPARALASPRLHERQSGSGLSAATALHLLTEGDYNTRRAVRQLGVPVPGAAALVLKLVAEGSGDSAYQVACVTADAGIVEELTKRAAGKEALPVRRAAILALAGLKAKGACPALVKLLDAPDVGVVAARALGRLADGDGTTLLALGAHLKAKDVPVAYACADALRGATVPAETAAAIVKGLGELKPAKDETPWPALLAADKLGEPGVQLMMRVVAAAGAQTGASYRNMVQAILGTLLTAGVPANDPTIQKAVAVDSTLAERLAMYADTKKVEENTAKSYREFWKNIDADAAASGPAQEVW